ncbi:MAG: TIGR02757 family protein [Desulfomonile tiedjei]|nr:TIGR02757 family protein [Desulfomonile tiedjei]
MVREELRDRLDELYEQYNRREFVHPDPLEFLYEYEDRRDREIVGVIASGLAYGSVLQILKSVRAVLDLLVSPHRFLMDASRETLIATFRQFKHRFTTGEELAGVLFAVKQVIQRHGSLGACFEKGFSENHTTVLPAAASFVKELCSTFGGRPRSLLASPEAGSACKRLNLFLRWMVRRDAVDPGGWDTIPRSKLIVPLDTHMHRIALRLGLTGRKQANLRTACEITDAFRSIQPQDPVRYDFALTRLGIRKDLNPEDFLRSCTGRGTRSDCR